MNANAGALLPAPPLPCQGVRHGRPDRAAHTLVPAVSASDDFFENAQPAAVLKHGLLTRYSVYFAGRAGKATGRVSFIDGYAGAGRYSDGSPGSPLLLVNSARRSASFQRVTALHLFEQDPQIADRLRQSLGAHPPGVHTNVIEGDFASHIGDVFASSIGASKLFFLDPFGLGLPRARLLELLRKRSSGDPLDVIYHFSIEAVRRQARAALSSNSTESARTQNTLQLDMALGPDEWRDIFLDGTRRGASATSSALEVCRSFVAKIASEAGMAATSIDVRARPDHQPKYSLVLFSRDRKAHWDFADQAGLAHLDWLLHCERTDFDAYIQTTNDLGILTLFPDETAPVRPTAEAIAEKVGATAVRSLVHHLSALIVSSGPIRLVDDPTASYGPWLGRARQTHIRTALKLLYAEGRINDAAKGDYWLRPISTA